MERASEYARTPQRLHQIMFEQRFFGSWGAPTDLPFQQGLRRLARRSQEYNRNVGRLWGSVEHAFDRRSVQVREIAIDHNGVRCSVLRDREPAARCVHRLHQQSVTQEFHLDVDSPALACGEQQNMFGHNTSCENRDDRRFKAQQPVCRWITVRLASCA